MRRRGLKVLEGDLLEYADKGFFDVIVHGCNCFNRMGKGIAAEIAEKYPQAKAADNETRRGDIRKLGNFSISTAYSSNGKKFDIVNAYTQYYYYRRDYQGEGRFDINNLYRVLNRLFNERPDIIIGMPLIGAGLGREDADKIEDLVRWYQGNGHNLLLVRKPSTQTRF